MGNVDASAIFLDVLAERCRASASELESILALNFPSKAPKTLAECLVKGVEKMLFRIEQLRAAVNKSSSIPRKEIHTEASTIRDFLDSTSTILCPMLRNSATSQVPSELVLPMERLARVFFPDCQVIVEGVSELNWVKSHFSHQICSYFEAGLKRN